MSIVITVVCNYGYISVGGKTDKKITRQSGLFFGGRIFRGKGIIIASVRLANVLSLSTFHFPVKKTQFHVFVDRVDFGFW